MSETAGVRPNPIHENRQGHIGRAVDRYEGPLKVSGTAPYAHEVKTPAPPAYGVLIGASIGKGRVVAVDDAAARASPGVAIVWHPLAPPAGQTPAGTKAYAHAQSSSEPVFASREVAFFGQPVALVVADTLENAAAAAHLIEVRYQAGEAEFGFDPEQAEASPGARIALAGGRSSRSRRCPVSRCGAA